MTASHHGDFSAARGLLEGWAAGGTLPAAAALAQRGGEVLFEHAAGCARRDPLTPIDLDAIWAVASISKPFSAAAVMQLVESGRIGLDQPVVEILPEFGPGRERIRVRNLLNHTSGMSDEWPTKEVVRELGVTAALASVRILFEPGAACSYSTTAFTLLDPLIQRITGLSFEEYMRERFFLPLGMRGSSFEPPASWSGRIPDVYDAAGAVNSWWSAPHQRRSGGPGGGLFSTLRDLAAFGQAFVDGGRGLVSDESYRTMTTCQTPGLRNLEGHPQSWGLGWYLYRDDPPWNGFAGLLSREAYGHGGATGTWLGVDPASGVVIVLLANRVGLPLAKSSDMQARLVRAVMEAL